MQEYLLKKIIWQCFLPIKEANDIKKEPVINATEPKSETVNEKTENEEKNNGNHTPV